MGTHRPASDPLRDVASRLGLGRLLLQFWHQPVGRLRDIMIAGGPLVMRATERGRAEMEAAADELPPLPDFPGVPRVSLHVLTGRRYWYQTAFCLRSLSLQAQAPLDVDIHDDGSIDSLLLSKINSLFPSARVHNQSDIIARLHEHLPEAEFPALRKQWRKYPNIRKLIAPHVGSSGWKLVIDSDILFFRRPDFLLDWLRAPDCLLHAVDCQESYGYPRTFLEALVGTTLPPLVNVGICGLRSEDLDWNELENWCRALTVDRRASYYLEQALVAMLASRQRCAVAPAVDYVTCPSPPESIERRAIMHHYVAGSKRWYFQNNWRHLSSATG